MNADTKAVEATVRTYLAAMQRAFEDRAVEFAQMAQYPPFKAIAAEPQFQALMLQVGLPR